MPHTIKCIRIGIKIIVNIMNNEMSYLDGILTGEMKAYF